MKSLLLIASLTAVLPLSARTFTSSDGSKSMEAELISFRPSTDTIVFRHNGKNTHSTAKASAFSKDDQAYFKEFLKESAKSTSLNVTSEKESEKFETGGSGIYNYEKKKESFVVSVENRGDFNFEKLTAKYDIYVSKYDKAGNKVVEVVSGEESITEIHSQLDAQFNTKSVDVTIDCSTSESCPKCQAHASSVKRERVIGLRVRVYNEEDEMLTEFHSSSSARSTAEKKDQEA